MTTYYPSKLHLARTEGNVLDAAYSERGCIEAVQFLAKEKGYDPSVYQEEIDQITDFIKKIMEANHV